MCCTTAAASTSSASSSLISASPPPPPADALGLTAAVTAAGIDAAWVGEREEDACCCCCCCCCCCRICRGLVAAEAGRGGRGDLERGPLEAAERGEDEEVGGDWGLLVPLAARRRGEAAAGRESGVVVLMLREVGPLAVLLLPLLLPLPLLLLLPLLPLEEEDEEEEEEALLTGVGIAGDCKARVCACCGVGGTGEGKSSRGRMGDAASTFPCCCCCCCSSCCSSGCSCSGWGDGVKSGSTGDAASTGMAGKGSRRSCCSCGGCCCFAGAGAGEGVESGSRRGDEAVDAADRGSAGCGLAAAALSEAGEGETRERNDGDAFFSGLAAFFGVSNTCGGP